MELIIASICIILRSVLVPYNYLLRIFLLHVFESSWCQVVIWLLLYHMGCLPVWRRVRIPLP
jgi:hypothetical protein